MAKKAKYQEYKLKDGTIGGVWCAELQMGIPKDENNVDWQEYLEWVAEGNKADPPEGD
tara:strand:- start:49 stop:222 length:174 start_codon:yes stop_codon:yes gene_type:complete